MKNVTSELEIERAVASCWSMLRASRAKTATKYLSPTLTVKITKVFGWKEREYKSDFRLSIGSPNYYENKFIKACKASGEAFPVKRVQLKHFPEKRK